MFTLLLAQGASLRFVVFQAAAGPGVFGRNASLLIGAVALSMLISPLLLVLLDRARCAATPSSKPPQTRAEISEPQEAPVIIAGFGRYGQIVARDAGPGHPHHRAGPQRGNARNRPRLGYRVFYMATPPGWTCCALPGPSTPALVVAWTTRSNPQDRHPGAQALPQLQVVARARDLTHWNAARPGVTLVQRELFESSLASARTVLELMGQSQPRGPPP